MNKYRRGKIYILKCKDTSITDEYTGSTIDSKGQRFANHKVDGSFSHRRSYNASVYQFIRANGGFDNWELEIIENYPCQSQRELNIREGQVTLERNSSLNSRVAGGVKRQLKKKCDVCGAELSYQTSLKRHKGSNSCKKQGD